MAQAIEAAKVSSPPVVESTVQNEPVLTLTPEDALAIENLVTEDDTPADNLFSEKQQHLLTGALYDSWKGPGDGRPFIVAADVGVFRTPNEPPLVPDVFLSLDVRPPADWWAKPGRSYFLWEYGKPPDVVIEVVSNTKGGETDAKLDRYAHIGVPYYVIFDPIEQLQEGILRAYELTSTGVYVTRSADFLPGAGLGLKLWRGVFEEREDTWLRWHDASGTLILTGAEGRALEKERADRAESLNDRLAAQLRALGTTPENGDCSL
jgi:Uma2 family endonuclease